MLNLLEKIIEETKDDNHLFARYGFKFYQNIENDSEKSFEYLKNKPNFKNDFQYIYMCGLIDHFYKEALEIMSDTYLKNRLNLSLFIFTFYKITK